MIERKIYEYNGDRVRLRLDDNGYVNIQILNGCTWSNWVSLYGGTLPALIEALKEFEKLNPK